MRETIYDKLDRIEREAAAMREPDAAPVGADASPLDFLCAVYRNPALPLATRIRASIAAAQYCHPKISVIAAAGDPRNFADELERRIARHRQMQLIEAQPQPTIRRRI